MGPRYVAFRLKQAFLRPGAHFEERLNDFRGHGLEVGGPSAAFAASGVFPAYDVAQRIDNVTFSTRTRWEGDVEAGKTFRFHTDREAGTQFVLEGSGLSSLAASSYDFVLSCHPEGPARMEAPPENRRPPDVDAAASRRQL